MFAPAQPWPARVPAVLHVDLALQIGDVVEQLAGGITVVRTGVGVFVGGRAIVKDIRTGGGRAQHEIVAPVGGLAVFDQVLLAIDVVSVAAPAGDLALGQQAYVICGGAPFCVAVESDQGIGEVPGLGSADPAVLGLVDGDEIPGIRLVGIGCVVGFSGMFSTPTFSIRPE